MFMWPSGPLVEEPQRVGCKLYSTDFGRSECLMTSEIVGQSKHAVPQGDSRITNN